jgi:tetratricopeptide (TPR) repeat protein
MSNKQIFWHAYLQVGLLLLAVFALYAQSLHDPFVFDDLDFDILSQYGHTYFNLNLRWLPYASLGWTVNWFGFEMLWLRLGNVLLHATNVISLFFLLRQLFRITLASSNASHTPPASLTWFAFFGALIFALHPVAVYGVTYLIQRSILMATLFVLLMLLTYLQGLLRGGWLWMAAAVLFYFAAVYSKEHSIAAPGVALALTFLVRKPSVALFKYLTPYYLLCALIALIVVYTTSKTGILAAAYEPNGIGIFELSAKKQGVTDLSNAFQLSILTQSFLFFKYLWLWLLPAPAWMSVDMREPFAMSFLSWPHTLGLVAFLAYPCVAIWLLLKQGRLGLLGFALLFPWLLFLTELSTVRAQEPFVLYRSYLWMPGLLAALPVVCAGLAPKRAFALLGMLAVLLIPLSLNRLNTFSSALLLWDDAEKLVRNKHNMPGVERIYYIRGYELAQLKRYDEAIANFTTAIAIYPGYDFLYCDRATAYYMQGKHQEALHDYNRAIAINSKNPISYNGRALVYRSLGDNEAAQEDFRKSCALGLCPHN